MNDVQRARARSFSFFPSFSPHFSLNSCSMWLANEHDEWKKKKKTRGRGKGERKKQEERVCSDGRLNVGKEKERGEREGEPTRYLFFFDILLLLP